MGKRKAGKAGGGKSEDDGLGPGDEGYKAKRARNNEAVKKSREKSRQKESINSERVNELRTENLELERQVETLKRELNLLKELFVECAAGGGPRPGTSAAPDGPSSSNTGGASALDQFDFSSVSSSSLSFPEQVVTTSRPSVSGAKNGSTTNRNAKKKK